MLTQPKLQPLPQTPLARVFDAANRIILGKEAQIRMSLACLLARSHLLIEDLPGVGETALAHVLASRFQCQFPVEAVDLLPTVGLSHCAQGRWAPSVGRLTLSRRLSDWKRLAIRYPDPSSLAAR